MSRSAWAFGACIGLIPCPGAAQTPPDVMTLAKTVQKLNQRVDRLEKDRDRLQKQVDAIKGAAPKSSATPTSAKTAAANPPPVTPPTSPPPKDVAVPGWEVQVVPNEDPSKDAVANFDWKEPTFDFGLHTRLVEGHNPYTYKGTGYLHVGQNGHGRYVVSLTLDALRTNSSWFFTCAGNVKINGETLAQGSVDSRNANGEWNSRGEIYAVNTFSGGSELFPTDTSPPDPGKPAKAYTLTFEVACYADARDKAALPEQEFKHWQDNRFTILIKGPHDPKGRALKSDEFYHVGDVSADP